MDRLFEVLTQVLSPEQLRQVGIVAGLLLVIGGLVWLTGVRIARPGVALAMAGVGFAVAFFVGPKFAVVAPLTAGLIGLVVGLAVGVIAFRVLQAVVVAGLVGLGAAIVYYAAYMAPEGAQAVALVDHASGWPGVLAEVIRQCQVLGAQDAGRLVIIAAGVGLTALLVALGFPKVTTVVGTAAAGAAAMLLAAGVLVHCYVPGKQDLLPVGLRHQVLVLGVMVAVGVVVQCRFFLFRADKSSKTTGQAVPVTSLRPV